MLLAGAAEGWGCGGGCWSGGRSVGERQETEPGEVQKRERSEFELKLKNLIVVVADLT